MPSKLEVQKHVLQITGNRLHFVFQDPEAQREIDLAKSHQMIPKCQDPNHNLVGPGTQTGNPEQPQEQYGVHIPQEVY